MSLKILSCFLVLSFGTLWAQNLAPVNLVLSPNKSLRYEERVIYAELLSTINRSSALYHQVERKEYDAILEERTTASKIKDDPYLATVLKGAAVSVELNIVDYEEVWDSIRILSAAHGRDYDYKLKIKCSFDLKVVDVATSEVIDSKLFEVEGFPTRVSKSSNELQRYYLRMSSLGYVRRGVRATSSRYLLQVVAPAVPIYKFYEDNGSKNIFIAGGENTAYPKGTAFRLVRESQVIVNNKAVLRQETVGEAVVHRNLSGYTHCVVTRLKEGVDELMLAPYVLPSPKNKVPLVWSARPAPPKQ